MKLIIIYSFFVITFFGNFFVELEIIPAHFTVMTEIFIYFLFLYSLLIKAKSNKNIRTHLWAYYSFFILISLCSTIANFDKSIQAVYGLRLVIRFYLFYIALINLEFHDKELIGINNLLIFLFLIQLPSTLIKFYLFGISEETPGIYGRGGGNTTLVVLIAIGYLAGFYLFYKAKKIFIMLSIFYVLYGIVGAKAALILFIPLQIIILYFLYVFQKGKFNLIKQTMISISILLSLFLISSVIIKYNIRLNKERKIGGTIDYSYAFDYIKKYTMGKSPYDENISIGRTSTFFNVTKKMWNDGYERIFFGYGPGSLTPSLFKSQSMTMKEKLRIGYGITGTVYILAEYGVLGFITILLVFLIFIQKSWSWLKNENDPYWKAIAFGSLNFTIINTVIFLAYNKLPVVGDLVPPIYFYSMSLMFNRHIAKLST